MAVDALELRPRGAVALLDAAVRLCGRALGVWSLALPAGAALTWALFEFVDAARLGQDMTWPAAGLAGAWLLRGVAQGAACHHLEAAVVGAGEPDAAQSALAALKRLPSLVVAVGHNLLLNLLALTFTGGLALFFLGSHLAAYAVAMRGQGHPLAVYATSARLLGPARHTAGWLRVAGVVQALVALNLHLGATVALQLAGNLLALDVTYADRFASLDNPVWVALLGAVTFTLFEPLRAACATLLLVDGQVRLEGLDLAAALAQVPRRRKARGHAAGATAALLLALALPHPARAQASVPPPTAGALSERLGRLAAACGAGKDQGLRESLRAAEQLAPAERSALSRLVARLERRAFDDEDCEGAVAELRTALALARRTAQATADAAASRDAAKDILARPEFQVAPPAGPKPEAAAEDAEPPGWFSKWWDELWESIWRWLRQRRPSEPIDSSPHTPAVDLGLTNVVLVAAVALVVVVLLYLLLRGRTRKDGADADAQSSGLSEAALHEDPMSALARPPEGWADLADVLAQRGEFRDAIRHLYLATLSRLHRDGAIDYDPAKSNWDYFRGFKGPQATLGPFRELTSRFDFAWYGNLDVTARAWQTFRSLSQPLLEHPEAPRA